MQTIHKQDASETSAHRPTPELKPGRSIVLLSDGTGNRPSNSKMVHNSPSTTMGSAPRASNRYKFSVALSALGWHAMSEIFTVLFVSTTERQIKATRETESTFSASVAAPLQPGYW
jgi:hypothetical protein